MSVPLDRLDYCAPDATQDPLAKRHMKGRQKPDIRPHQGDKETDPDWTGHCELCGQSPILPVTGMCGPCTFGESETMGGDW